MTDSALFHGYVTLQARGTVTLPAELRKHLRLDEPGAQLELTERDDGVLELRVALPVPANERWFWEERWQAGEHEVDAHVGAGEVSRFDGPEEFLASLDDS